jgi:hypothetical protein
MAGLLAWLLMAIEIRAAGDCPGAADVERRLAPLLGEGTTAGATDVATIKRAADGTLALSLADAAGRALGERRFPRAGTCSDQADTVAVTLAIWEAQLHPEISLRLDRLSPEAAPAPPRAVPTVARAAAPPPPARTLVSLGAAAAGAWQPGSWAPAARVELAFGREAGRWRARIAALGFGRHTMAVAPGQAHWWRASLSLGADYDLARGERWAVVLGAGALTGMAWIAGDGFTVDRTSRSVDAGGEVRARAEWRRGRVRPWLGISLAGWLRGQALELEGAATSSALPRVEPAAALGVDFVW